MKTTLIALAAGIGTFSSMVSFLREPIPLVDYVEDITGKAQRGLGIDDAELLSSAGISAGTLEALRTGSPDEETVRRVAPVLGLDPERLVASARKAWYAEVPKSP
ncbi:MAG TPA: hypothetical protein VMN36_05615 [Verrucomicrobiales bacterium]|nr:hypothetical protein [Verrucomicrobiales bacterium]